MSEANNINGARYIAELLDSYDISHVFYIDAILRKTLVELDALGIQKILTHSEKAAAYMADGYARISQKPGVCMAQSVGAANLAAGLQDAFLGKSPVVALTGKKPPSHQKRNAYQEVEHAPFFNPVTKFNEDITSGYRLPYLLNQAFREALSGVPGPTHLDVLGHNGRALESEEDIPRDQGVETVVNESSKQTIVDTKSLKNVIQVIQNAQKPVIVAGGGVRLSQAQKEVVLFAEKTSIPVATTVNGKGTILDGHPLGIGVVGTYSSRCANQIVSEADLVIFIGSGTGDQTTFDWCVPGKNTAIVQFDINPLELGRNYSHTVGVIGDAKTIIAEIIASIKPDTRRSWLNHVESIVKDWQDEIRPLRESNAIPIRPERLCKEISDILPKNGIIVSDTGYSAIWTATMLQLKSTEQTYLRAAGSLGWAFPASLGVKCGVPERPVICFTGDGGFLYHLSELETASRYGINTVTVVNNNNGLSQGIPDMTHIYKNKSGSPESLYSFRETNYAKIAQDFGCNGIRVDSPDDISASIQEALNSDSPTVIDVFTDINCIAPTPWKP